MQHVTQLNTFCIIGISTPSVLQNTAFPASPTFLTLPLLRSCPILHGLPVSKQQRLSGNLILPFLTTVYLEIRWMLLQPYEHLLSRYVMIIFRSYLYTDYAKRFKVQDSVLNILRRCSANVESIPPSRSPFTAMFAGVQQTACLVAHIIYVRYVVSMSWFSCSHSSYRSIAH